MELAGCSEVLVTSFDKRGRLIQNKKHTNQVSLSIRRMSDGFQVIVHIGKRQDMYITSQLKVDREDEFVQLNIPEFRARISVRFDDRAHVNELFELSMQSSDNPINTSSANKENERHSNRTLSRICRKIESAPEPVKPCKISQELRLSPLKSGFTPQKKKTKPLLCSPEKLTANSQQSQYDIISTQRISEYSITTERTENEELSYIQQKIYDRCMDGKNVFFTGGAGTGKSYLLKCIVSGLESKLGAEHVFVTATTGLAACAIGGVTVHQFSGIRPGDTVTSDSSSSQQAFQMQFIAKRWKQAKVLVVDEISMMSPAFIELLNLRAQKYRGNSSPMGGLQVIFTGDFFQLPPVENSVATTMSQQDDSLTQSRKSDTPGRFCFQSEVWSALFDLADCFVLEKVYRQLDNSFSSLLNMVRWGNVTESLLSSFQVCVGRTLNSDDGILPTRIFTHRRDVDKLNTSELHKLNGDMREFRAFDEGRQVFTQMLHQHCPAKQSIKLKVGAQVVLVKTINSKGGLVNGARGVVVEFSRNANRPVIKFCDGVVESIGCQKFPVMLGGRVVAQRTQIPLDLAWGISVHKSQGMSVDKAVLDIRNVFEYGQAYVALSRVRTLDGLSLSHSLQKSQIRAHPDVKHFYSHLINTCNNEYTTCSDDVDIK